MWVHKIALKHLYTCQEDHETIQITMNSIADAIEEDRKKNPWIWRDFSTKSFRNIPKGDEYFGPVDYANKLLTRMYDYADVARIWIE